MWWLAAAQASTVPITPQERCDLAELAVVARVDALRAELGPDGVIRRTVTLAIEESLRPAGAIPPTLEVVSLGGTVERGPGDVVTQRVEDEVAWVPGQRYLVFALRWNGAWRPVDAEGAVPLPPRERDPTGRVAETLAARAREACRD